MTLTASAPYKSKDINRDFLIKVYGVDPQGNRINKLVGIHGILALIGETLFVKFVKRAYRCMADKCVCKLRRGIKVTLYFK